MYGASQSFTTNFPASSNGGRHFPAETSGTVGVSKIYLHPAWAEQAIRGLCDVHAEGYVHGDFTLSNLAIDEQRDAKIIDFNRRGCPIGWEPPELDDYPASLYIVSWQPSKHQMEENEIHGREGRRQPKRARKGGKLEPKDPDLKVVCH